MTKENQFGPDGEGVPAKGSEKTEVMRQRPVDSFPGKAPVKPKDLESLSDKEIRQLAHELQVHQIELEMQNEELRRTQEALGASQARYFDLYDLAPIGYFTLSEQGLILEANLTTASLLGVSKDDLVKQPLTRFILPEDQDIYCRRRKQLFKTGAPQVCEIRMMRTAAPPFWARIEAVVRNDIDGAPLCRAVMSNLTEGGQAERELRSSEEKFRNLVECISDVIYEIDSEGMIVYISPIVKNLLGYDPADMMGKVFIEFVYRDDRSRLMERFSDLRMGLESPAEYRFKDKCGEIRWVRTKTRPIMEDGRFSGARGTLIDINERKRAENDLIETMRHLQDTRDFMVQFEKQAVVGRLAASVAHEILNPATIISSRIQFMEEENIMEPARENLRVCREQLQRIIKITHDLHQSSHNQKVHLISDDFRRVVEVGLQMTDRRIKDDHIWIEYESPAEDIPVKMDVNELVKVMVHLILNACDAMAANEERRLIITVQYHEVSPQGLFMRLIVADNGTGIPTGDMDVIFYPFFTTKEPGKGTGLGLSVCRGIIREHGGKIHAENNDMGGASLVVELPLYDP